MPRLADPQARRVAVNINLSVGLLQQIDQLAEALGTSRSALIRSAIEQVLEDASDIAVADARMADPNDPVIPWEQVKAEMGL
ncbi:ribbon-helix-helix domain-containing protein [bacterium]|nr:ribbon-helix-helix domain-containing protein [bacterium]